jgi:hypothetical protein
MLLRWQNVLASPDWEQVVKPVVQTQIDYFTKLLRTPLEMRNPPLPSRYIQGVLDAFEYLIKYPEGTVNAALADLVQEIVARQFDMVQDETDTQGQPLREEI